MNGVAVIIAGISGHFSGNKAEIIFHRTDAERMAILQKHG
jgi:hypothetical protein